MSRGRNKPWYNTEQNARKGPGKRALKSRNKRAEAQDAGHLDTLVWDPKNVDDLEPHELVMMKNIAATLERHYPPPKGMPLWWGVEINHSVVNIFNLSLSGREGYILHVDKLSDEKVVRAGGEILERYGVPRDPSQYNTEMILQKHHDSATRFLQAFR